MVNQSKVNDPRFWKLWGESGAVGTIDRRVYETFAKYLIGPSFEVTRTIRKDNQERKREDNQERNSLEVSGLTAARNLRPGQVYTMKTTYEGIEGEYFRVISNDAPNLRPGMGTPNVRCEAVERKGDGWIPRKDVPNFSVYDFELVRIQGY